MITSLQRLSPLFSRLKNAYYSKGTIRWLVGPMIPLLAALVTLPIMSGVQGSPGSGRKEVGAPSAVKTPDVRPAALSEKVRKLQAANAALSRQLKGLIPSEAYLVIDTAGNRVFLRQGEETRAEMLASCGSGNFLQNPKDGKRWVFDTPRGQFTVKSKLTDPVWIKPDWAYLEEGEEIPKNPAERALSGMMGDYALGIGNGYFIHGTLYSRLLGRNVSHGCVRLGEKDLALLYRTLPMGTRVIIF